MNETHNKVSQIAVNLIIPWKINGIEHLIANGEFIWTLILGAKKSTINSNESAN